MANPFAEADKFKKKAPPGAEPTEEPVSVQHDFFAGLNNDKPKANSYAFYLTDENVKKLRKLAKQKGVSASKLLDHILSEILI